MTDSAFPDRLTQLKSRWESDPSSRIFLQLAEEYRHQGRVKEALSVLDRGLKEHPGYLSALVAKGRCHLELGEPEPARTVLERVVKQDPTQMVANKLLVRAYLDTGEPEKARERLDLYSLLNDSDPEIEELRRRLRAMEPPQAASTSGRPSSVGIVPPRPAGGDDIFDLGAPPAPAAPSSQRADEPFADLWPPPTRAAQGPQAASASQPPEPPDSQEPNDVLFPGLASRESRNRYLRALTSEGLFFPDLIPPAEPEPEPAAVVPQAVPAVVPEPGPAFAPEAEPSWALPAEAPEPPEFPEPASFEPEPFEPALFEPAKLEPTPFEPEPAAEPIATATLGEIYLRQGHRDEAERIFREVLRREPESSAAREGLARLGPAAPAMAAEAAAATLLMPVMPRVPQAPPPVASPVPEPAPAGRPLEARDLLARFPAEPGAGSAKARKVFLLNSYLQRLRRGGERDVS
jgi:tetratricopeptide (TPR) repeat protein